MGSRSSWLAGPTDVTAAPVHVRHGLLVSLFAVTAIGCGAVSEPPVAGSTSDTAASTVSAGDSIAAAEPSTPSGRNATSTVARIDEPAISTTPAQRLDDDIIVTWIGGSELELDGRSLPTAVAARHPSVGDRAITLIADTVNAPLPSDIAERVTRAAARNVDGIIVSLPPSWLAWDGHDGCRGMTPPHVFYACILEPRADTDVDELRADVSGLFDVITASGVPAYVYVQPHSAEALADAALAERLTEIETSFRALDPGIGRVRFIPRVVNRDLPPMREGVDFFDMVHPTASGIERLADYFAAEIERFAARAIAA